MGPVGRSKNTADINPNLMLIKATTYALSSLFFPLI